MELLDLVTRITGHLLNNKPAFKRRIIDWKCYAPLTQPILSHIMGKYCNIPVSSLQCNCILPLIPSLHQNKIFKNNLATVHL